MNYIVIDLEWNQSPLEKESKREMPFEIIEIGAVKLDNERNIIGQFNEIIRPQIYHEIHFKTKEIIHTNMEDLEKGDNFNQVVEKFFQWCGKDYYFCTWGSMDLVELQRNIKYYNIKEYIDKPILYYDIQKIFSWDIEGKKVLHTLEYAVDYLKISKKEEFHRALSDAIYTAKVLQKVNKEVMEKYYSIDYYHNPKTKKDEIKLIYDSYTKYISREFLTKEEALEDLEVRDTICYKCGKKTTRKIQWFTNNTKSYYSLSLCKEHGFLKGKIRVKKTLEGKIFIVKILKLIDEKEVELICNKKKQMNNKKKRQHSK